MGVPELVEFPRIGVGKMVTVSEPRRGLSVQFAMNCELWSHRVTALHGDPAKDRNTGTLCLPLEEVEQACAQPGDSS